ncbi:MAG: hypothetical protein M3041_09285, partial [Acidobacteriota bacterium]|nr:hypothetical protein [Acidobacteriota bacterium]
APHAAHSRVVIGASASLFLLGLIDDFLHIKPYQKLIGQLMAAALVIYLGLVLPWTTSTAINMVVTFFWLVGITNAVNMLDNMDGLAGGVSAIAAIFLGVNFFLNGQYNEALTVAAFAGALIGFLFFNHSPASIFMGDCGSMFIGFFLASSALLAAAGGGGRSRSVIAVLAVPVLVLCIPIFDTTFVTLMRKLAGRPASLGGRDHTSHRLVALGLSEKHAVWMLYALAISGGPLALLVRKAPFDVSVAVISAFAIMLAFLGIHLARVRVYGEDEIAATRGRPIVAFLFELSQKMRAFEVALDAILISLAYYLAYAFRFGPVDNSPDWQLFMKTLPIVISVKLATFLATGIYRGIWRYASLTNVLVFLRAVVVSTILTVLAIVFAFRFDGFSRGVFLLDGLFLVIFVTVSRFAFKLLHRIFPSPNSRTGRRVLIFGAGDGGELLYREINNNPALNAVAVAFADDDRSKSGRLIHGLRVYRPTPSVAELCQSLKVEEVIISTSKVTDDRIAQIIAECAMSSVAVSRARIHFERLKPTDLGWVLPSTPSAMTTVTLSKPRVDTGSPHSAPQPSTNH